MRSTSAGIRLVRQVERTSARADGDRRSRLDIELRNGSRERRRKLHDCLGGLDLGDGLVQFDELTDRDVPGDELGLGETLTEVGHCESRYSLDLHR